jgi:hypothetical protein
LRAGADIDGEDAHADSVRAGEVDGCVRADPGRAVRRRCVWGRGAVVGKRIGWGRVRAQRDGGGGDGLGEW